MVDALEREVAALRVEVLGDDRCVWSSLVQFKTG
jgi:hypothetical protein